LLLCSVGKVVNEEACTELLSGLGLRCEAEVPVRGFFLAGFVLFDLFDLGIFVGRRMVIILEPSEGVSHFTTYNQRPDNIPLPPSRYVSSCSLTQ
jgi:hypothetical protein